MRRPRHSSVIALARGGAPSRCAGARRGALSVCWREEGRPVGVLARGGAPCRCAGARRGTLRVCSREEGHPLGGSRQADVDGGVAHRRLDSHPAVAVSTYRTYDAKPRRRHALVAQRVLLDLLELRRRYLALVL